MDPTTLLFHPANAFPQYKSSSDSISSLASEQSSSSSTSNTALRPLPLRIIKQFSASSASCVRPHQVRPCIAQPRPCKEQETLYSSFDTGPFFWHCILDVPTPSKEEDKFQIQEEDLVVDNLAVSDKRPRGTVPAFPAGSESTLVTDTPEAARDFGAVDKDAEISLKVQTGASSAPEINTDIMPPQDEWNVLEKSVLKLLEPKRPTSATSVVRSVDGTGDESDAEAKSALVPSMSSKSTQKGDERRSTSVPGGISSTVPKPTSFLRSVNEAVNSDQHLNPTLGARLSKSLSLPTHDGPDKSHKDLSSEPNQESRQSAMLSTDAESSKVNDSGNQSIPTASLQSLQTRAQDEPDPSMTAIGTSISIAHIDMIRETQRADDRGIKNNVQFAVELSAGVHTTPLRDGNDLDIVICLDISASTSQDAYMNSKRIVKCLVTLLQPLQDRVSIVLCSPSLHGSTKPSKVIFGLQPADVGKIQAVLGGIAIGNVHTILTEDQLHHGLQLCEEVLASKEYERPESSIPAQHILLVSANIPDTSLDLGLGITVHTINPAILPWTEKQLDCSGFQFDSYSKTTSDAESEASIFSRLDPLIRHARIVSDPGELLDVSVEVRPEDGSQIEAIVGKTHCKSLKIGQTLPIFVRVHMPTRPTWAEAGLSPLYDNNPWTGGSSSVSPRSGFTYTLTKVATVKVHYRHSLFPVDTRLSTSQTFFNKDIVPDQLTSNQPARSSLRPFPNSAEEGIVESEVQQRYYYFQLLARSPNLGKTWLREQLNRAYGQVMPATGGNAYSAHLMRELDHQTRLIYECGVKAPRRQYFDPGSLKISPLNVPSFIPPTYPPRRVVWSQPQLVTPRPGPVDEAGNLQSITKSSLPNDDHPSGPSASRTDEEASNPQTMTELRHGSPAREPECTSSDEEPPILRSYDTLLKSAPGRSTNPTPESSSQQRLSRRRTLGHSANSIWQQARGLFTVNEEHQFRSFSSPSPRQIMPSQQQGGEGSSAGHLMNHSRPASQSPPGRMVSPEEQAGQDGSPGAHGLAGIGFSRPLSLQGDAMQYALSLNRVIEREKERRRSMQVRRIPRRGGGLG
ncbi:MAG: hypothetical protein M1837_002180 [Sclerophora amabilis]|nr:MAG: hypothetical protein M1837_002180 [Sclerophora amabilis]